MYVLCAKGQHVVIAEGQPLQPLVDRAEFNAIANGTASIPLQMKQAAALFDYETDFIDNVFLWRKRYTDPMDLPCVTIEEVHHFAVVVSKLMEEYISPANRGRENLASDVIRRFLQSLTAEQMQTAGGKGIAVGQLTVEQQRRIGETMIATYLSTLLYAAAEMQRVFKTPDTLLIKTTLPEAAKIELEVEGFGGRKIPLPLTGSSGRVGVDMKAITEPATKQQVELTAESLVAVVERLRNRDGLPAKGNLAPALNDKPLTVAGEKNAPGRTILRTIARLYGLRFVETKTNWTLDFAPVQALSRKDIRKVLIAALPEPIRRTYRPLSTTLERPVRGKNRFSVMYYYPTTARRYALTLQPKFVKTKRSSMLLSEQSSRIKVAVALIAGHEMFTQTASIANGSLPEFFSELETLIIRNKGEAGERSLNMSVCLPTGQMIWEIQTSIIPNKYGSPLL